MSKFICQINKELIDLGAIEMDEVLKRVIPDNISEININIDGNYSKVFKIDRDENIITGRGIKGFFKNIKTEKAAVAYDEHKKVMNYLVKYSFKISYISDNTIEEFEDVIIDMNSLSISDKFYNNLNNIFYDTKPQYDYPLNCKIDFLEGFKEALKEIERIKEFKTDKFSGKFTINREVERINQYYESLKLEAEKRMKRKNLSEDKINEYKHKIKIYDIEKDRQINEITEKYRVKSQVIFQNALVYAVPMICFKYKLSGRNVSGGEFECLYNMALKDF